MQIRDQLQRLEHQMAERQLRGHIYLTPDGPIILSTTTTYADRKTGQSVVVGPGPIREALGANASKVIDQVTATTTNRTKAGTGRGVAPVLWNTTCLVVTGTTAAHALIVALYHPGEYDEHELTELARQAPCRNRHELRTAFEDATGVGVPVQSATWLKTVEMISRENPQKHSKSMTTRAQQTSCAITRPHTRNAVHAIRKRVAARWRNPSTRRARGTRYTKIIQQTTTRSPSSDTRSCTSNNRKQMGRDAGSDGRTLSMAPRTRETHMG